MKDNETLLKDLQAELNNLNEKIVKLVAFLHGKEEHEISRDHLALLVEQREKMLAYADVLRLRIDLVRYDMRVDESLRKLESELK
jgi:hypothetical protein